MPRKKRIDLGGYCYHVLNRGNDRKQVFHTQKDYTSFEYILKDAVLLTGMRILAYCLMPNHFHLVLYPKKDKDMSTFMKWVTTTHTTRYRSHTKTQGEGHLYQGRYKSFPVETNEYLMTVLRYVERNPIKANLSKHPFQWKHASLYHRYHATPFSSMLSPWPIREPTSYLKDILVPMSSSEYDAVRSSEEKSSAYGDTGWIEDLLQR